MRTTILAFMGALPFLTACEFAGVSQQFSEPEHVSDIQALESNLLPRVVFRDEGSPGISLADRMSELNIPAVSVAVIEEGEVFWSHAWGTAHEGTQGRATSETLFQAASISKPVTALGVMRLVEEGLLDLDEPVNSYLEGWTVRFADTDEAADITLRELLSHTAGTTVSGFAGYAFDEDVPTLVQILQGEPPANSEPVVVNRDWRGGFNYSGGGYTIVQKVIEDVTGQPFADVLDNQVLQPAGADEASFEFLEHGTEGVAHAHDIDGMPIAGDWNVYPELAAAGLWTNAENLARIGLSFTRSLDDGSGVISQQSARMMAEPVMPWIGLGFFQEDLNGLTSYYHSGGNIGYRSELVVLEAGRHGLVILTNGGQTDPLIEELTRAVANLYDWPGFQTVYYDRRALTDDEISQLTGIYQFDINGALNAAYLDWDGETLGFSVPGGMDRMAMYLVEEGRLVSETNHIVEFDPIAEGVVQEIRFNGFTARRPE